MHLLVRVAAVVALTAPCFCQEPAKKIRKVEVEYTNPSKGPEMFKAYCAACHGPDGKGTGPAASALKKAPADLTLLSKKNNGKYPALKVQQTILGDNVGPAHGTRDMPMWGTVLGSIGGGNGVLDLRVKNLTDYIQGMQAN